MSETSLYELLGLTRTATDDEVRTAYRRTARRVHPDAGGSEREFRRVHAAYRVLGDPSRRHAYDLRLARSANPNARSANPNARSANPNARSANPNARSANPNGRPADPNARSANARPSHPYPRPAGRGYPAGRAGGTVPSPDARARRWYLVAMGVCVVLFALAGAVVRDYSVPVAMGMALVAMVIPPVAAIVVNRPPPRR